MKRIFLFIAALLFITACIPFSGSLNVHKSLILLNKQYENVSLDAGNYEAEISGKKRPQRLELKLQDKEGHKQIFNFYFPEGTEIPKISGTFRIQASDVDQPWDLVGNLKTTDSKTDLFSGYEPCTIRHDDRFYHRRRPRKFDRKYWADPGYRAVEYYYENEIKRLNIQIMEQGTQHSVAEFNGQAVTQTKVYTYQGFCH